MIARKSFLVFLNMIAGSILGYIALFYILRFMGPEDYGIIGSGMAIVGVFAFLTELGFNRAHIKRISEGQDLEKCIGTFIVIKIILTVLMACTVLFGMFLWKVIIGRGFESIELERVIYVFILYYSILSLSSIPLATFSARRETARQQLPGLLEPTTRVPLTILVAVGSFGVFALAGAYLMGVIASFIAAFILFRGYPLGKFDLKTFKSYFKFAIPISIASGITQISANVDKIFLQLFWGARFVGYYFSVQRLTSFLLFFSTAVVVLLFPTMSEHHGKNEYSQVRKLTTSAERYVSIIGMPCAVLLIVFSESLLYLFNAELAENASVILQIMAISAITMSFMMIFMIQIVAVDKPRIAVKVGISVAFINIFLNTILIPKDIKSLGLELFGMGAVGAALATAISAFVGLIMAKTITKRLTKTQWNPRILLHLGASLIMGLVLYFVNNEFQIMRWYEVGSACLLGLGIYLGILWIIKEIKREDYKLFLDIINPKEMKRYISSELKGGKEKEKNP